MVGILAVFITHPMIGQEARPRDNLITKRQNLNLRRVTDMAADVICVIHLVKILVIIKIPLIFVTKTLKSNLVTEFYANSKLKIK